MTGKVCLQCNVWKPLSDFNKKGSGVQSMCRTCQTLYNIDYRKARGQKPRNLSTFHTRRIKRNSS